MASSVSADALRRVGDPVDANLATRRYRMDSECKGICLIINNMPDDDIPPSVVRGMLADTFQQLGFHTIYKENVSSADMHQLMREMQNKDHTTYNCFVCCICSHGNETGVRGADDQPIDVDALRKYFFATKCRSLAGKPKVFFVEACRGDERAEREWDNVEDQRDYTDAVDTGSERPSHRWELDEDHFFMSYATTPHHVAAYTSLGGHFFRCLTSSLLAHAARLPVDDILMLVGDRLGELGIEQTPICETTLRKKLYFSNKQTETRRRVDTPGRPTHLMGPYQDVYGRLVYPAPYPGEQVMSGATYPQDVYGHYMYPAPYLEEHVMSGDVYGRLVYNPGKHVLFGATYPPTAAKPEEAQAREGLDDAVVWFCAEVNTFTFYSLAKSLLVLISLMNVGCSASSLPQASCSAGTCAIGEPTNVTCLFSRNVADSRLGVNVQMFPLHSTKDIPVTGKDVLVCIWLEKGPKCVVKDGYSFNNNISDRLTLEIPAATPEIAGMYMCHVVLEVSSPHACDLTVTERREGTTSPNTTNGTTRKATSTTAEPSETVGLGIGVVAFSLGLSVTLICAVAVTAVILLMFYKRIQSRLTLVEKNYSCSDQTVEVQQTLLTNRNSEGN